MYIALLLGLAAIFSTYLGGLFALKRSDHLHLILGFSAGAVLGVAFFDLLPESLALASPKYDASSISLFIAVGFFLFMVVSRVFLLHPHADDDHCKVAGHAGKVGALSLSFHSFFDGVAIGLAFKVGVAAGAIVAAAVLAHDFSDGVNTVSVILKHEADKRAAFRWLVVDAVAPFLGVVSTLLFSIPGPMLGLVLAVFCGFFLYIGASDLLPESHHRHPKAATSVLTLAGVATIYLAVHFAAI